VNVSPSQGLARLAYGPPEDGAPLRDSDEGPQPSSLAPATAWTTARGTSQFSCTTHSRGLARGPVTGDDMLAASSFGVESRRPKISAGKWVRSLAGNLLAAVTVGSTPTWPPVDVIVVDISTNRTLRVWHEGGEEAATLMSVLNEDLNSMRPEVFLEEWACVCERHHGVANAVVRLRAVRLFASGIEAVPRAFPAPTAGSGLSWPYPRIRSRNVSPSVGSRSTWPTSPRRVGDHRPASQRCRPTITPACERVRPTPPGAGRFIEELVARVHRAGAAGEIALRVDSCFCPRTPSPPSPVTGVVPCARFAKPGHRISWRPPSVRWAGQPPGYRRGMPTAPQSRSGRYAELDAGQLVADVVEHAYEHDELPDWDSCSSSVDAQRRLRRAMWPAAPSGLPAGITPHPSESSFEAFKPGPECGDNAAYPRIAWWVAVEIAPGVLIAGPDAAISPATFPSEAPCSAAPRSRSCRPWSEARSGCRIGRTLPGSETVRLPSRR
jgi:hypothetical protein